MVDSGLRYTTPSIRFEFFSYSLLLIKKFSTVYDTNVSTIKKSDSFLLRFEPTFVKKLLIDSYYFTKSLVSSSGFRQDTKTLYPYYTKFLARSIYSIVSFWIPNRFIPVMIPIEQFNDPFREFCI